METSQNLPVKDEGQVQLWVTKLQIPWFMQEKFPQLLIPHKGPLPGRRITERACNVLQMVKDAWAAAVNWQQTEELAETT